MSDTPDPTDTYRRTMSDMLTAERDLRTAAEQRVRSSAKVLVAIGYRLDGDRLEELRRKDPNVLQSWQPEDWQTFFEDTFRKQQQGWQSGNGYHAKLESLQAEKEALEQQVKTLKGQAAALQSENERLETELAEAHSRRLERAEPQPVSESRVKKPRTENCGTVQLTIESNASTEQSAIPLPTYAHAELVRTLQAMNFKLTRPARFAGRLSSDDLRWERQAMLVYVMATSGINTQIELRYLLDAAVGNKPGSGANKAVIENLEKTNLLIAETLTMTSPIETRLAVNRLSDDGRDLCRIFGWEAVESEWERLLRLHEGERFLEHTLAVLAFAMQARLRGYRVEVVPDTGKAKAKPDLLIEKGSERHYVEVELSVKDHSRDKWRHLVDLQGHVALCAGDASGHARLVGDCKLAKFKGFATSLESFVRVSIQEITTQTPLWVEEW